MESRVLKGRERRTVRDDKRIIIPNCVITVQRYFKRHWHIQGQYPSEDATQCGHYPNMDATQCGHYINVGGTPGGCYPSVDGTLRILYANENATPVRMLSQ